MIRNYGKTVPKTHPTDLLKSHSYDLERYSPYMDTFWCSIGKQMSAETIQYNEDKPLHNLIHLWHKFDYFDSKQKSVKRKTKLCNVTFIHKCFWPRILKDRVCGLLLLATWLADVIGSGDTCIPFSLQNDLRYRKLFSFFRPSKKGTAENKKTHPDKLLWLREDIHLGERLSGVSFVIVSYFVTPETFLKG